MLQLPSVHYLSRQWYVFHIEGLALTDDADAQQNTTNVALSHFLEAVERSEACFISSTEKPSDENSVSAPEISCEASLAVEVSPEGNESSQMRTKQSRF